MKKIILIKHKTYWEVLVKERVKVWFFHIWRFYNSNSFSSEHTALEWVEKLNSKIPHAIDTTLTPYVEIKS